MNFWYPPCSDPLIKNEIEDLRTLCDRPRHVPFTVDILIQALTHEIQCNDEEIALLQQIVHSTGIPESERYNFLVRGLMIVLF